jgi:hypothetical protein
MIRMVEYKQGPVSQTVWPWQEPVPEASDDVRPPPAQALLGLVISGTIAGLIYYFKHEAHPRGAVIAVCVIATISLTITLVSLFSPKGYKVVHAMLGVITLAVSTFLSLILLAPFYFLCFPLGRLAQLLKRKDPMHRKFPGEEDSYWVPRKPVTDREYYKRQS